MVTACTGRVETDIIELDMAVNIAPVYLTAVVRSLEMHHETLDGKKSIFYAMKMSVLRCRSGPGG